MTTTKQRYRAHYGANYYKVNRPMMMRQLGGKCEICGFADPRALQFDHVDPSKKTKQFAAYLARKNNTKAFDELHFMRLLCANCHAISTVVAGQYRAAMKHLEA